jgi:mitochondrial enoyl-[acyl-carrier protein] reductase / trans-2-enoyl-CoA reductase
MKKIEITDFGAPEAVARCVEAPDAGAPAAGEIVIDVLAFPINPADLLFCRGRYQSPVSLPATPGAECVGHIAAVGRGVTDMRPGDLVIHLQRENWVQRRRVAAADAIPLPTDLDLMQAAMLRINPATALCLLEDHVGLRLGDWVIQNAANSAVGRHLTALAKGRGVHTIAVVNRSDVAAELQALGADAVLQDGADLAERAQATAGGAPIRLGIDAIGGEAGRRIGDCLADGGVVVSYGALSGSDPVLSRAALMRGVGVTGFGLSYGLARRTRAQVRELYADLAAKARDGMLRAPVEATYGIDDIKEALVHAQRRGRHGKVLVLPNGEL